MAQVYGINTPNVISPLAGIAEMYGMVKGIERQKEQDAYARDKDVTANAQWEKSYVLKQKELEDTAAYRNSDQAMKGLQINEQARIEAERLAMSDCAKNPNSYHCRALAASNMSAQAAMLNANTNAYNAKFNDPMHVIGMFSGMANDPSISPDMREIGGLVVNNFKSNMQPLAVQLGNLYAAKAMQTTEGARNWQLGEVVRQSSNPALPHDQRVAYLQAASILANGQ